ncbi:arsenate reductase family protein [Enterococcus asini]|uniref:arsenate reductase family protein n=1 Tax=Enterococcus TaxID=1350 RepID=UPI0028923CED|nr:arsenate reductase family protein [Enterococcus asini]MDT2755873.1 arsenate reductase family protein [Enterococcus asini]
MYTLYWYPKCSTCKKAKTWLEEHQVDFETYDMIQTPPDAKTIAHWFETSDLPLRRFFNTSGQKYRELGLKDQVPHLTSEEASVLLSSDGMLIKRPLLVKENQVVAIGFKETDYKGVFE